MKNLLLDPIVDRLVVNPVAERDIERSGVLSPNTSPESTNGSTPYNQLEALLGIYDVYFGRLSPSNHDPQRDCSG